MMAWYGDIKAVHVAAVLISGVLFLAREGELMLQPEILRRVRREALE